MKLSSHKLDLAMRRSHFTTSAKGVFNVIYLFIFQISKELDYWKWSKSQFFDSVFAGKWYNGKAERIEAYIGNKRSILVGMPRIRQLRVKPGKNAKRQTISFVMGWDGRG